jgi:DNA-binding LacI/PurR family transcriptional regulator
MDLEVKYRDDLQILGEFFTVEACMNRPTLSQIAEKTGFSLATVSYVLSGRKQFPAATRETIRNAACELGYSFAGKANLPARIALCFILQEPTFHEDIYFLDMMEGVLDCCTENGFQMQLTKILVDDPHCGKSFGDMLDTVQGVVLCNPLQDHRFEDDIAGRGIPYVVLGTTGNDQTPFNVDVDMKAAGYQCTDFLLRNGRRHIFFINLNEHMWQSTQRREGFVLAMENNGLDWDETAHAFLPATMEDSYRVVSSMIEETESYDAIVTSNEIQAQGTMKALQEHGIPVPGKIALISMGGTVLSQLGTPQLTTMDFDPHKNGYEAARLLFDILQRKRLQNFHLVLPGTLIERGST